MRTSALIVAAIVGLSAGSARAQGAPAQGAAVEHPRAPRVFHVPTGWLQRPRHAFVTTGANHRGGGFLAVSGGLGKLAELDVTLSDRFVQCQVACDSADRDTQHAWVASALFKIGLANDRLFDGQPAVALGFRKSFAAREQSSEVPIAPTLAELYLALSLEAGPVDLHLGGQLWDTEAVAVFSSLADPGERVRPFVGLSWQPSPYPRTLLLADFSWVPELQTNGGDIDTALRWLGAWGVRYQALRWASIELGVRHREHEGLRGSTVFVRLNASAPPRGSSPTPLR